MEMVEKILRFVVAFIDSGIVVVIRTIYDLFYKLSDLMLYSEKIVESLGQRIGLILGIFMLFRLAVSLITYLISPDKINDNAKGGGKLLINVVVSLVLLATVNIIFVQAYKIQDIIISSGFIEKIFFGTKVDTEERQKLDISYYLYTPLFEPNEEVFGTDCERLWDPAVPIESNEVCDSKLYEVLGDDRRAVYRAYNTQNMRYVLSNFNVVTAKQNGEYAFEYKYFAPIAGIVCAAVLISFSMDLATRAVKLLFLQIIAPIPIISNIDPNKGQEIFKKWYKECFTTYLSVFLRVLTINFAVYIITVVLTEFDDKNLFTSNPMITIALIIGALIFAKQVPKLIENIFGIKMEGAMTLNPLKKFQDQALFGKQILGLGRGAVAGAIGAGAGLVGGVAASAALNQNVLKAAGAGVSGLLKGAGGGLTSGYKSKNLFDAMGKGKSQATVQGSRITKLDGTTLGGRIKAGTQQFFGVSTDEDTTKKQLEELGNFDSTVSNLLTRGKNESIKHNELALKEVINGHEYVLNTDGNLIDEHNNVINRQRLIEDNVRELVRDANGNAVQANEYNMKFHKQRKAQLESLKNAALNKNDFFREKTVFDQSKYDSDQAVIDAKQYGLPLPDQNDAKYKSVVREFDEDAYKQAQNKLNEQIATLEEQINIDNDRFGLEYLNERAKGKYADDVETRATLNEVELSYKKLEKIYGEAEAKARFGIYGTDALGNKVFDAKSTKKARGSASYEKTKINISDEYKAQKANAAATRPKK